MSLRNPLSGLKKELKRRLGGGGDELEPCGADDGGESVGLTGSLPQPELHVVVGGRHDFTRPGNEIGVGGGRVDSTDLPPHSGGPEFAPVNRRESSTGEREAAIETREASRRDSYLGLGGEGVAESGPGREGHDTDGAKVDQIGPPVSTPSISNSGESGSTQTVPHSSCCL